MSLPVSLKTSGVVQENADFIVNPSNTQLVFGGGVPMAFRLHCGSDLGRLMQEAGRGKLNRP